MNVSLTEKGPQDCAGSHFLSASRGLTVFAEGFRGRFSTRHRTIISRFVVLRAVQVEDSVMVGRDPVL